MGRPIKLGEGIDPETVVTVHVVDGTFADWSAEDAPSVEAANKFFVEGLVAATAHCIPRGARPRPQEWWS